MPILGAVVRFDADPVRALQARVALAALSGLELGEDMGDRLPVVLDVPDRAAEKTLWRTLCETPGVAHLELAFADFSDLHDTTGELP